MTVDQRTAVAAMVDHTLLKPEATDGRRRALVAEATDLGVYAVCVSPSMVRRGRAAATSGLVIADRRRIPFWQAPFGDQGAARPRWPSPRAPTRSTWSSTSARPCAATSPPSAPTSPPSGRGPRRRC